MSTTIKAVRVAVVGAASVGSTRIRGVHYCSNSGGVGRVTLTDGNGGATLLDFDIPSGASGTLDLAEMGIRFENDPYVSALTNVTAVTILYG